MSKTFVKSTVAEKLKSGNTTEQALYLACSKLSTKEIIGINKTLFKFDDRSSLEVDNQSQTEHCLVGLGMSYVIVDMWYVRKVTYGAAYGVEDCLTYEGEVPMIEFYDHSQDHKVFGNRGQFVARYNLDTLQERVSEGGGLALNGSCPEWSISGQDLSKAIYLLGAAVTPMTPYELARSYFREFAKKDYKFTDEQLEDVANKMMIEFDINGPEDYYAALAEHETIGSTDFDEFISTYVIEEYCPPVIPGEFGYDPQAYFEEHFIK